MEKSDYRCKHCLYMYQKTTCTMRWCNKFMREMYAESLPCPEFRLHLIYKYYDGSDK